MLGCQLCEVSNVTTSRRHLVVELIAVLVLDLFLGVLAFGGFVAMHKEGTTPSLLIWSYGFAIGTVAFQLYLFLNCLRYTLIGRMPYTYLDRDDETATHMHRFAPPPDVIGDGYVLRLREGGIFQRPRLENADGGELAGYRIRHRWNDMSLVTIESGGMSMTVPRLQALRHLKRYKGGLPKLQQHDAATTQALDELVVGLLFLTVEIQQTRASAKSVHAKMVRERIDALLAELPKASVEACRTEAAKRIAIAQGAALEAVDG